MSLKPVLADFVGEDRILQGTDWMRTLPMTQDMTAYDPASTPGAVLRAAFRSADLRTVYFSSATGGVILSFDDALTLRIHVTAAASSAVAAFSKGVWDVEGVNGLSGYVDRIAEGVADCYREVTTAAT